MKLRYLPRIVMGCAAWSLALPAAAAPNYRPVTVETRFKDVDPARVERVRPELHLRATQTLETKGVGFDPDSNVTVLVQVLDVSEHQRPDKAVGDYATHVEVQIDGEVVGDKLTPCMRRGEAELVGCALSGLPEIMHLIPQEEEVAPADPEPQTQPEPQPQATDKPPLAPLGPVGVAGVVVAAVGLGLGVAGGIDLARGNVDEPEDLTQVRRENHDARGVAFVAGGAVALLVGGALIGVGVVKTKKKQRKRTTRMQFDATPNYAGLRFSGRF